MARSIPTAIPGIVSGNWMGGEKLTLVVIEGEAGDAVVRLVVRQGADHHAAGNGIEHVRADEAGLFSKIANRVHEPWLRRIGAGVEDENLAVVEAPGPKIFAVVGEPHVMRLAAAADGHAVDHRAIGFRFGAGFGRDKLVGLVAETFFAQRPDMQIGLLALDERGRIGREARLVRPRNRRGDRARGGDDSRHDRASSTALHRFLLMFPRRRRTYISAKAMAKGSF